MENTPQQHQLPTFSDYLNQTANKLSVLGIFNALLVYSFSLKGGSSRHYLIWAFLILTFVILFTLVLEGIKIISNYGKSSKIISFDGMLFILFFSALGMIFYGLFIYYAIAYPSFLGSLLVSLVYMVCFLIPYYLTKQIKNGGIRSLIYVSIGIVLFTIFLKFFMYTFLDYILHSIGLTDEQILDSYFK